MTHNHPEGLKGGAATAAAVFMARNGLSQNDIKAYITEKFGYDLSSTVDLIRPDYRFNETCQNTVPQALICFLEADSFEDAIRNAISIGGDSDTIGAIVGGIAEAKFGIPDDIAQMGWGFLPSDMRKVMTDLYAISQSRTGA